MKTTEIAWLAGFLEGEGSFAGGWRDTGRAVCECISVTSTDLDVLQHAAQLLETGVRQRPAHLTQFGTKTQYQLAVSGVRARGWMMTIYPLLGERRQARVREILAAWRNKQGRGGLPGKMAECHPAKPHRGKGLCQACYTRSWRATRNKSVAGVLK